MESPNRTLTRITKISVKVIPLVLVLLALFVFSSRPEPVAADPPPRTVFVHLFEWKWTDIAQECENFLGPKGFSAVQVSPPNEHIDHRSSSMSAQYAWWARYQPVTYDIASRSGSRVDFDAMVARCDAVGVDIYVDAVINHMADQTGLGIAGSTFNRASLSYPIYSAQDFHSACVIQSSDYSASGDPYTDSQRANNIRNCQLGALPDLDTGKEYVRATIASYMQGLVDSGVKGFRIDAAKHMHPNDVSNILGRINGDFYVFQEVIDPGGQPVTSGEYTDIADVTEFKYSQKIGQVFNSGNLSSLSNFGEAWGFMGSTSAVVFVDNHDNQRGHGMAAEVTHRSGSLYDLANVYMLAWPYGYPKVMSSYEWGGSNDNQGPPHDGSGNTKSVYNNDGSLNCFGNDWKCEHRWQPIANMVAFHNEAAGADAFNVTNWWSNGNNQIAFSRSGANGTAGFVVINREGNTLSRSFQTGMTAGMYCNITQADFDASNGSCSGETITVDSGGWASITVGSMKASAIHIGAKIGSVNPTPTPTSGGNTCASHMYERGTNNGWTTTAMTLVNSATCEWSTTASFGSSSTERFKFDVNGDWSSNYGDNNGDGYVDAFGNDIAITQGAGSYTITYVESSGAYTVVKGSVPTPTAVPTQLPTATPQPTATPTGNAIVTFTVNGFTTQVGQDIYVVGNVPELGNWNPNNAVPLNWVDSDTWSGPVTFTTSKGQSVQFKFIVKQGSSTTWQSGGNRTTTVPSSGTATVVENW